MQKNRTKDNSKTLLCLVQFLLHQMLCCLNREGITPQKQFWEETILLLKLYNLHCRFYSHAAIAAVFCEINVSTMPWQFYLRQHPCLYHSLPASQIFRPSTISGNSSKVELSCTKEYFSCCFSLAFDMQTA